jgi:hypothetical protein
MHPI